MFGWGQTRSLRAHSTGLIGTTVDPQIPDQCCCISEIVRVAPTCMTRRSNFCPQRRHYSITSSARASIVVSARIGDKLKQDSRASMCDRVHAVFGGWPDVEFTHENERRYAWTGADPPHPG